MSGKLDRHHEPLCRFAEDALAAGGRAGDRYSGRGGQRRIEDKLHLPIKHEEQDASLWTRVDSFR
jgi:hypothetical protein